MRLFTVHQKGAGRDAAAADGLVFVKDGVAWPGLFIPVVWLLWRRLWLGALIWLVAALAAGALAWAVGAEGLAAMVLVALPNLWVFLEGNDMRRRKLARRGLAQIGAVTGRDRIDAERRFFAAWAVRPPAAVPPARMPAAPIPVLGLMTGPGALR